MQQWGFNYWEAYLPVVNWIIVRSLLSIASIQKLPITPIEFLLEFTQSELAVDVFVDIPLGMGVYGKIGQWVLNLNKSLYGLKQESENWFDPLKTVLERRGYHQSQVDPFVFYRTYLLG